MKTVQNPKTGKIAVCNDTTAYLCEKGVVLKQFPVQHLASKYDVEVETPADFEVMLKIYKNKQQYASRQRELRNVMYERVDAILCGDDMKAFAREASYKLRADYSVGLRYVKSMITGRSKLNIAKRAMLKTIAEKIATRMPRGEEIGRYHSPTLADVVSAKADAIAQHISAYSHISMGGKFEVRILSPAVLREYSIHGCYDNRDTYRGGRYTPTHDFYTSYLPFKFIAAAILTGGLYTEILNKKTGRCRWLEIAKSGKRIASDRLVEGYLIGDKHFAIDSKRADRLAYKREWRAKMADKKKFRAKMDSWRDSFKPINLSVLKQKKLARNGRNILITKQDSLNAGNCEAGTRAFMMRNRLSDDVQYSLFDFVKKIDAGEIRIDGVETFVSRILIYAMNK